jgi:lysophospholipase L1-like esterase
MMERTSRRLFFVKLLLPLCGVLIGLSLAEGGLRLVERARAREREAFTEKFLLKDPRLNHRVAPGAKGHDANGFRNDAVPARAEVVALGDSQTWGVNAERTGAWPQVLGRMSGRAVYNMGVNGYGPVQYWALTEQALGFSPKVIVVGVYTGNDLYDVYKLAYTSDDYKGLRAADAPPDFSRDTIGPRADALWDEEKNFQQEFGRGDPGALWLWLGGHTAVGRLLAGAGYWPGGDVWFEASKAWARAHPDHGAVYEEAGARTVLTTAYRLTALDLDDPRVAEGLRITCEVLPRIKARADAGGAKLLVVLIPTKEAVFAGAAGGRRLDPVYERLVRMESRVRADVAARCDAAGVEHVDALPALVEAVRRGEAVYPTSAESHPRPEGYLVLASTVRQALEGRGW